MTENDRKVESTEPPGTPPASPTAHLRKRASVRHTRTLSGAGQQISQAFRELLQTEVQYVEDIRILVHNFMEPIVERNLLSKFDVYAIFSNIHVILPISERFLSELSGIEKRALEMLSKEISNDKKTSIPLNSPASRDIIQVQIASFIFRTVSELFCTFIAKDFQQYLVYCSGMGELHLRLQSLTSKNSAFALFLEEQLQNPICKMLDVHSFLVKPMQRLTQYPMILKEVRKSFDKTTEEFALLTEAIDKCDQMLQVINQRARIVNDMEILVSISNRLYIPNPKDKHNYQHLLLSNAGGLETENFDILDKHRKLLTEGPFPLITQPDIFGDFCFLFNDIMILAQTLQPNHKLCHSNYTHIIRRIVDRNSIIIREDFLKDQKLFLLQIAEIEFQLFIVGFPSKIKRKKWVGHLNSAIESSTNKPPKSADNTSKSKKKLQSGRRFCSSTHELGSSIIRLPNTQVIIPVSQPPLQHTPEPVPSRERVHSQSSVFAFWKRKTSTGHSSAPSPSRSQLQAQVNALSNDKVALEKQVSDLTNLLQESYNTIRHLQEQLEKKNLNLKKTS